LSKTGQKICAIAVTRIFHLVKVLDLATLIWYKITGKCALPVIESEIEKKTMRSKFFTLSPNVAYSISFDMKKFNAIVIAARFRLDSLERCMYSQKWLGF